MEELPVFTTRLSVERRFFGWWGQSFFFGPVTWLQLAMFVGTFLVLLPLEIALNAPGGVFWMVIVLVGGPMAVASVATSGLEQTDRKRPHLWLLSQFRYLLVEGRTLVRFEGPREPRRFRLSLAVWQRRPAPARTSRPASRDQRPAGEMVPRQMSAVRQVAPLARRPTGHPLEPLANVRWTVSAPRSAVGGIVRFYVLLFGVMAGVGLLILAYVLITGRPA